MIAKTRSCAQYTPQKRARVLPPALCSSAKASAVGNRRMPREEIQRESRIGESRRAGMVYGVKAMRALRRAFISVGAGCQEGCFMAEIAFFLLPRRNSYVFSSVF